MWSLLLDAYFGTFPSRVLSCSIMELVVSTWRFHLRESWRSLLISINEKIRMPLSYSPREDICTSMYMDTHTNAQAKFMSLVELSEQVQESCLNLLFLFWIHS